MVLALFSPIEHALEMLVIKMMVLEDGSTPGRQSWLVQHAFRDARGNGVDFRKWLLTWKIGFQVNR